ELIEQLDFALSQRHRAAIYAGDPQTVITGVTDDDAIGASGRTLDPNASVLANEGGKAYGSSFLAPFKGMTGGALKRGVMHPWLIKDPQGKAVVMALPGDALDALDKDANDI